MRSSSFSLATAMTLACIAPAHAQGDAASGRQLYAARCSACHSLEYNGVGPTHQGLIGRRAGTAAGYSYSTALKQSQVTWNEDTLTRWLADPEKFIAGQKMFISIPDARERADLVAFLLQAARPPAAASATPPPGK